LGDRTEHKTGKRADDRRKTFVVALTGPPGSGKTTVGRVFRSLGAALIPADRLGHQLLTQPQVREHLVSWLGEGIAAEDGVISRHKLAQLLFADREILCQYDNYIHPLLLKKLFQRIADISTRGEKKIIVIDAALVYEWGLEKNCDAVVVVFASMEDCLLRCMKKFQESREQAANRINSQLSPIEKVSRADFVIDNSGSLAELREKAKDVFRRLEKRFYGI
jgi:dephospho-CoA kinase